jgi:hypothetical protein
MNPPMACVQQWRHLLDVHDSNLLTPEMMIGRMEKLS